MPIYNVAIPETYHGENVPSQEVGLLYVQMLLKLETHPRKQTIDCEDEHGIPETTTVIYRHPENDDVLMQFTVRHD